MPSDPTGQVVLVVSFQFRSFFPIAIVSFPFFFDQFLTDVLRASPDREILACRAFAMFANLLGLVAVPVAEQGGPLYNLWVHRKNGYFLNFENSEPREC